MKPTRVIGRARTAARSARFVGVATPVRRGRGPAIVGHRRRWSGGVFRRYELAAWAGIVLVLGVTAVFAVRAVIHETEPGRLNVRFQPAAPETVDTDCVVNACVRPVPSGPPTRIRITALGVEGPLEDLGLDADGQLQPPQAYDVAGWYAAGVAPGDPGPAVIAGHVDSAAGPAVFYRLSELAPGDTVDVLRGETWLTFVVTATERYAKDEFPSDRVYRPTPDSELRLITCGGDFDHNQLSYRDNLVVYAVIR